MVLHTSYTSYKKTTKMPKLDLLNAWNRSTWMNHYYYHYYYFRDNYINNWMNNKKCSYRRNQLALKCFFGSSYMSAIHHFALWLIYIHYFVTILMMAAFWNNMKFQNMVYWRIFSVFSVWSFIDEKQKQWDIRVF